MSALAPYLLDISPCRFGVPSLKRVYVSEKKESGILGGTIGFFDRNMPCTCGRLPCARPSCPRPSRRFSRRMLVFLLLLVVVVLLVRFVFVLIVVGRRHLIGCHFGRCTPTGTRQKAPRPDPGDLTQADMDRKLDALGVPVDPALSDAVDVADAVAAEQVRMASAAAAAQQAQEAARASGASTTAAAQAAAQAAEGTEAPRSVGRIRWLAGAGSRFEVYNDLYQHRTRVSVTQYASPMQHRGRHGSDQQEATEAGRGRQRGSPVNPFDQISWHGVARVAA